MRTSTRLLVRRAKATPTPLDELVWATAMNALARRIDPARRYQVVAFDELRVHGGPGPGQLARTLRRVGSHLTYASLAAGLPGIRIRYDAWRREFHITLTPEDPTQ